MADEAQVDSVGRRNRLPHLYGDRTEGKLREVEPTVAERVLHERRALGAKGARPSVTIPEILRPPVHGRHLARRNLLCQGDVRMVFKRLVEFQRLRIYGRVDAEHLRITVAQRSDEHTS